VADKDNDPPSANSKREEQPAAEKVPDALLLQRLRAETKQTGPLAEDVRRELRRLRAEKAEGDAEATRRELQRLRAELSADSVRSVKEAVAGEPGVKPFDKLAESGRAALAERDYEIAVRDLTRAAVLDPSDRDVQALLDAARQGLDKVNKEVPEALAKAKKALLDGDVEEAKNIYAVLLLVAPKDRRVREAVARLQARIAKGEVTSGGESRWLTVDEIEALAEPRPRPSYNWRLGDVNPEIYDRAVAAGRVYRLTAEQQGERSAAAARDRTAALQGETDRARRWGKDHDAGTAEEGERARGAGRAWLEAVIAGDGRIARAGREARAGWDEQEARRARIARDLEGAWRQQDERIHGAAAGQMLGLLQHHDRIAEAVRQHDALAKQQGERMAAAITGARGAWAEQGERVARAGRENDAGLRLLLARAQESGRQLDAGVREQDERGAVVRHDDRAGRGEVGERLRAGAREGRENVIGQGPRFEGIGRGDEMDERFRAADRDRRLTAWELEERIKSAAHDKAVALQTRHSGEVKPPPEPDRVGPPPPQVEDPAEKQKRLEEADRAQEERNRKAREAAELRRLLAEREQRRRDVEELKKLLEEKEALEREAAELKLLRAEKERLERLREGLKGVTQDSKKKD
jgi:hypothetical protein